MIRTRRHRFPTSQNYIYKTRNFQTRKQKKPGISIIGVDKLMDSRNSYLHRFVWLSVLITMSGLCCFQLYTCLDLFLTNPVIRQTRIFRSEYVRFPAIYLCPSNLRVNEFLFSEKTKITRCSDNRLTCLVNDPYGKHLLHLVPPFNSNLTMDEAFKLQSGSLLSRISFFETCADSDNNCERDGVKIFVNSSVIDSFWGRCLLFDTAGDVVYRGPFTYLKMILDFPEYREMQGKIRAQIQRTANESERKVLEDGLYTITTAIEISLHHSPQTNRQHRLFFDIHDIIHGFETHLQIRQKQFTLLNRKNSACETEDYVMECTNRCFERNLSKICRPLYNKNNGAEKCHWNYKLLRLMQKDFTEYARLNLSACDCPKVCNDTTYTVFSNVINQFKDEGKVVIKLDFADNNVEYTNEKYSYDFRAFMSEIGGNLGFCLGFCSLSVIEILEFTVFCLGQYKYDRIKLCSY